VTLLLALLLAAALAALLMALRRLRRARGDLERLGQALQAARSAEQAQREQAASRERERIYADLHDDLGAKLLGLIHRAPDAAYADAARAALQDLRDVVTRSRGTPGTLADVLGDALSESGEALSGTSSGLAIACRLWHRTEGAAARTVAAVAAAAGYGWRVLADGSVWLGVEGWPAAPEADVTLVERDPSQRRWVLGGDVLSLRPGTLLQVRDDAADAFVRVGPVRLDLAPDAFTATVWQAP